MAIGGCDKNMPGCAMAMARLNRPAVFVYGGTILPGAGNSGATSSPCSKPSARTPPARITERELLEVERMRDSRARASCGGMYTANTMASAIEALGMSLPNSSAQKAVSRQTKLDDCRRAGAAVVKLLERGISPRDILTGEGVRERHHRRHRARRLDQRRAAPARHRARRAA